MKFSLFFMGYKEASEIPEEENERRKFALSTSSTIELTQLVVVFLKLYRVLIYINLPF